MNSISRDRLRVALLAGGLTQGGAEKQLVYVARALAEAGADVRVFCTTRGDYYEDELTRHGLTPVWIGRIGSPPARLLLLAAAFRRYRPHVVQAGHFFMNLYAALTAPLTGALSVGCLRSDAYSEVQANGAWGRWLLRMPAALLANSESSAGNAVRLGADSSRVRVLHNVIDLGEFDQRSCAGGGDVPANGRILAMTICRLIPSKRIDRFLQALVLARKDSPRMKGVIVGDGPQKADLEERARALGLLPDHVQFLGGRSDVPALAKRAAMVVLTSDHEGFPNVILEGMAAMTPVIATAVGDAPSIIEDGRNGFVVPPEDVGALSNRMSRLAASPEERRRLGLAGRKRVEELYSFGSLGSGLLDVYRRFAAQQGNRRLLRILSA